VFLPVVSAVSTYYDLNGHWHDLLSIQYTSLAAAELSGDQRSVLSIKTRLAWIISQQGHLKEAEILLADALSLAHELHDLIWQCDVLTNSSIVSRRIGDIEQANMYCQQALLLVPSLPEALQRFQRADIDYELGKIARDRADWKKAQQHFLAAQEVFRADDEDGAPAFNLERAWGIRGQLALISHHLGELEPAAQMYRQALDLCHNSVSKGFIITLHVRIADLEEQRGNRAKALTHAHEALEWSKRLGMVQERVQAEAIIIRLEGESS
jgi:tetratricopeptide (TPR) repeat protein